uniref:Scarecrow-like protein 3 n=1 Tax=Kalanchoe fedtschenkoi TaxID=63787 RepID=A0A7N0ZUS1_KALFE
MAPTVQEDGSSSVTSSPLHFFSMMSLSPGSAHPWLKELKSEERGLYLIHLLLTCANHVANGSLESANVALDQISQIASPDGDTMQRIASYFTDALANRILKSWPGLYRALNSARMLMAHEEILVQKLFLELFPFLKIVYTVANQAIMEAMEGEKMIHVIDLCSAEPAQWVALLQALSVRPEGPPHLRITGIHQQKAVLDQMAQRLNAEAERLDIPFQFNPVVSNLECLDFDRLRVKTGEALAISSILQLHKLLSWDDETVRLRLPDKPPNYNHGTFGELLEKDAGISPDSTSSSPLSSKMDSFLMELRNLLPKVMVVAEQDSNHNGSSLMERLTEALYYYAALFDCLESTVSRASLERLKIEKILFGEEIKNIIACEGRDRKERHEKLCKWVRRLGAAGFGAVPLSCLAMLLARRLLQGYGCDGYRIKDENGSIVLCWQDRALFSVSAWRCRR